MDWDSNHQRLLTSLGKRDFIVNDQTLFADHIKERHTSSHIVFQRKHMAAFMNLALILTVNT